MKLKNIIEPYAVGFLNADKYEDMDYKIACGLLNYAKFMPITVNAGDFYVGEFDAEDCGVKSHYFQTISVNEEILKKEMEEYPHYREELDYILEKMLPLAGGRVFMEVRTEGEARLMDMKACWGGEWGGHGNPDYETFLKIGTTGIIAKIEEYRKKNPGKDAFYDALVISMQALEILAERYSMQAYKQSLYAEGKEKEHLLRISKCLKHCPKNPPRDFFEACQMFWLCFLFMGSDSPGRFDQFMIDYYKLSPKREVRRCLERFWPLFLKTRTWNLCISGSDEKGNDMTNELSYMILETCRKFKLRVPNLTMRVHMNTPERLWDEAIKTIATGIGMPVLYNDECVCRMLKSLEIPDYDAHDYCMNGCNQIDIMGKSHMGLEDGEVSLIKCLELTLFNGQCQYSKENIGLSTGETEKFADFAQLMDAYKKQVEFITDASVSMANKAQQIRAELNPNPFRSCLIQGCIEKGKGYSSGGPLYNHGQILAEGIADTADSLAAIKYYIYETGKYTMKELKEALAADFVGYDELYRDFSGFKKFGNDDDYVDQICADIVEHFFRYLMTKRTYRGGTYTGGCSPFNRVANYGAKVKAMPNGKHADETTLADSIGAVPGEDKSGITALLHSVLKHKHSLAGSGFVLNLKLYKSLFENERGHEALKSLMKTFFAGGGQQISPMVVSPEELQDALIHPEKHQNLIVRVGGYSDYFVKLTPELQENIVKRSCMML